MRPTLAVALLAALAPSLAAQSYPSRVEIRRTAHGVPHILAQDLGAMGYGLAWAQLEDHGERIVLNLVRARGQLARLYGPDSLEADFAWRPLHDRAVATWDSLDADVRSVMTGWAAAVNRWLETHPDAFQGWALTPFTPQDAAALWGDETVDPATSEFRRGLARHRARADSLEKDNIGSNAWAFGPGKTRSGRAILLRNPHLGWGDRWFGNYYEAHVTVPGVINFYGDFRVGFPLYFNGGFNDRLGWATTNNAPDLEEVYALDVDPTRPDHVLLDGRSMPLERVVTTVEWKNGPGYSSESREMWRTPFGPVVERGEGKVYVLKSPGWGEYRKAQQFLRMMRAGSLDQWKDALRLRAHTESNLTYADREGNVFYVWNAALPRRPHPSGGDTAAVAAHASRDMWSELYPLEALPQLLNPPTAYLQNANDPFHFTNLESPVDSARFPPPDFPGPSLSLRSQLSLLLVTGQPKVTLDDVVRLKHSTRMLAGERFADDLVAAVRATAPTGDVAEALALVEAWDRTASPEAKGAVLFDEWYGQYVRGSGRNSGERARAAFTTAWNPSAPLTTPDGLADPARAAATFAKVVAEVKTAYGRLDMAWGDLSRMRRGPVDVPIGGCNGSSGCFRVLFHRPIGDGRYEVAGGDGWVLAVEFGKDGPRARSVLAYGESSRPDSPWYSDQAAMFARGEMKVVAFSEAEIAQQLVRSYRPE